MLDADLIHAVRSAQAGDGVVFQTSTIEALLHGAYEGDVTVAELAGRGDLGIGTFDGLDGELVAVDGTIFRAAADGTAAPAEPGRRSPFAVMARFAPGPERRLRGPMGFAALLAALDAGVPPGGACCAVRLEGDFERVRLRSVPAQSPPYRPLDAVLRDQRVFELADVRGTVVGFRFPASARGLDVPGFHLHFLTEERARGGHVLACRPRDVVARLDPEAALDLELPPGVSLPTGDDDVEAVERLERDG
jgi:acetolactate decarboxylase